MDEMNLILELSIGFIQNMTIEERVTILESQVVEIQEDVTGLNEDVIDLRIDHTELEGDVNFLFDEQVIQDERLLNLETETNEIAEQLISVDDDLESMLVKMISKFTTKIYVTLVEQ